MVELKMLIQNQKQKRDCLLWELYKKVKNIITMTWD